MLGWTLRIILILLVARALWRLLKGVLEGAGFSRDPVPSGLKLVRDPVCGVFVAPARALTAAADGQTRYFCSEKCRTAWRGR